MASSPQIIEPKVLAAESPNSEIATEHTPANQHTAKEKDLSAFKKSIKNGESVYSSMLAAGFPKSVAKMGIRRLPPKFLKIVTQERRRNIALARQFTHEELKDYVVGGLITNTLDGEDKACKSFELLGKTKELAMFTPESTTGVIVIQAAALPSFEGVPTLPAAIEGK